MTRIPIAFLAQESAPLDSGAVDNLADDLLKDSLNWKELADPKKVIKELIYAHLEGKK